MIRAILAHDEKWGVGRNGQLPWPHNPKDLAWFKETTLNSTVVMGRKTWDSLPFKPLPGRHNIVVSKTMQHQLNIEVVRPDIYKSRTATIAAVENVWLIGGARLIVNSLDIIDELWLNNVGNDYDCDVFLPKETITTQFTASEIESRSFGTIIKWIKNENINTRATG
jgi:dihydrofolate reductase